MNPEAQLAAIIVRHFRSKGLRVGCEVQVPGYDELGRADLVLHSPAGWWTIHTKLHLGLDVISQAFKWVPYCHRTYIAVPQPEQSRQDSHTWRYALHVLARDNIGLFVVRGREVIEIARPRGCNEPGAIGLEILPEHETAVAGNDAGVFPHARSGVKAELLAKLEGIGRPVKIGKLTNDRVLQGWLKNQLDAHPHFEALRLSGQWFVRRREAA